jgi:hypothetical protein
MTTAAPGKIGALGHLLALPFLVGLMFAGSTRAEEVVADPPSRVARLSHTDGEVTMAPAGTEEWAEAILNRPLTSGDRLWTEAGARAELQIGSAAAYLDERTSFSFVELDDDVMQMSLTEGSATIRVRRRSENESIQVETPNVAVSLTEPGEYHIEVDAESDRTIVKTRHGEAEVFGNDEKFVVRDDEQGVFSGLEQLTTQIDPLGSRTAFENWANDRERREHESKSAQYVSRDVVGYEDLDEHGEWLHEPEYGYVWRPRYVSYGWAPYRDGRWVWVSPWGWTWVDHARWGFAPFHYGRWAHVRSRWCWVPGPRHYRAVYAPALVGWVGRPHVSVSVAFGSGIGWFPLGPREVYIPGYWHSPRYIRHVNRSNTIIVNNTYITNVYAGRPHGVDYRYGRDPHAITAVERGRFLGGQPVRGRILRVNENDLREWRHERRPPALTPDRASVLAGNVRRAPPVTRDHRDVVNPRPGSNRVAFDTERSNIEANGGRPIARTQLYRDNPKDRGDFNRSSSRTSVSRGSPRVATQNGEPAVRGFSQSQRIESAPAVESFQRREPSSRDRISDNAGRALRDSGNSPRIPSPSVTRESRSYQRDEARIAQPRIEERRSIPREAHPEVRTQAAPPVQSQRSFAPRESRVESEPSRVERAPSSRQSAPSPRQDSGSSNQRSRGGRDHSGNSRRPGSQPY